MTAQYLTLQVSGESERVIKVNGRTDQAYVTGKSLKEALAELVKRGWQVEHMTTVAAADP